MPAWLLNQKRMERGHTKAPVPSEYAVPVTNQAVRLLKQNHDGSQYVAVFQ